MASPPIRALLNLRLPVLLGVLAVASTACGSDTGSGESALSGVATTTVAPTTTTVPDGPAAIISLSPTATEILFAIGAGDQVIAVDNMSSYPADAPVSELSGFTPNVEAIAGYEPDLVVISYDPGDLVEGLEALEIPTVMQWAANSIDDTYSQTTELGQLTGHATEAAAVNASIRDGLAAFAGDPVGSGMTYFHEIDNTLYSATSTTFVGQLYALLGLENIADPADEAGFGWPQLSAEFILESDPDIIFLADAAWGESAETVAARPGWDVLTAVMDGHVVPVDQDTSGRWGPRVVDFIESVKAAIEGFEG
ncbi:MAG: ABC transporter substrate-binding protein [Actinobacteria bacterium]|jgi:iron complex transport system substrate-binding protein|nr:ABC transporter substrate-binding protein [Actinomycetota bacterium]MBT3687118.1 ABC transporter substrate-binding protein [Actinomycetota bacterium]MBT4037547.1 ABC transporter substrate-binding protein [Actinomycetota bacterium]MBT4279847.1 ABC transporter substrate-binding protein [Actinomycetota bacterium]MBT4342606.1 ABC transporter substrate-binding protein [Actinomycetota bacterium]